MIILITPINQSKVTYGLCGLLRDQFVTLPNYIVLDTHMLFFDRHAEFIDNGNQRSFPSQNIKINIQAFNVEQDLDVIASASMMEVMCLPFLV